MTEYDKTGLQHEAKITKFVITKLQDFHPIFTLKENVSLLFNSLVSLTLR